MQDDAKHPNSQQKNPARSNEKPDLRGRRISSLELLQGRSELIIEHQNREYRLRLTHSGKLILTA